MGKRRHDIFTVVEFVPNWFEASEHVINHYGTEEGIANGVGTSCNVVIPPEAAGDTSNWAGNSDMEAERTASTAKGPTWAADNPS